MEQNMEVNQFNKAVEIFNLLTDKKRYFMPTLQHYTREQVPCASVYLYHNIEKVKLSGKSIFIGSAEQYTQQTNLDIIKRISWERGYKPLATMHAEVTRKLEHRMIEGLQPLSEYTTHDLSIKLETPVASKVRWKHYDNIVKTRYQGEAGTLEVTHFYKENPNVFLDNLYQSIHQAVKAEERREERARLRKLRKLNIQTKATNLIQQSNTQDSGCTMES